MTEKSGPWALYEREQLRDLNHQGYTLSEISGIMNRKPMDVSRTASRLGLRLSRADALRKDIREPISLEHEQRRQEIHQDNDEAYVERVMAAGGFWYNEVWGSAVIWFGPKGERLTPLQYVRHRAIERVKRGEMVLVGA